LETEDEEEEEHEDEIGQRYDATTG